jgi:hypothetical protein
MATYGAKHKRFTTQQSAQTRQEKNPVINERALSNLSDLEKPSHWGGYNSAAFIFCFINHFWMHHDRSNHRPNR